jgi:hypothetical protein
MATTTNYSWSTPDDTALVKDGAAAIRSLGTAIDSTVFTNAGAAIAKATVDAKGDLIAGTADNTIARLAVGANGTTLVADSSTATGLKWETPASGGMTLLETLTLSGASVTSSAIPGTYNDLRIISRNYRPANDGASLDIRINGDTGSNYSSTQVGAQIYGTNPFTETAWSWNLQQDNGSSTALGVMLISDYANAVTRKTAQGNAFGDFETTPATNVYYSTYRYAYNSTSAITSLTFKPSTGNFTSGSVLIYGVK